MITAPDGAATAVKIDIVSAYHGIATSLISDCLERLTGMHGLLPYHNGSPLVGTALTIKTREGDNQIIHQALKQVQPGQVIVVDGAGDTSRALIGEIIAEHALARGAAGFVIDGAIRDVETISKMGLPVFARGVSHLGPYKTGPGLIGQAIACAGSVVMPGDLIVGDADGVIALSFAEAKRILSSVKAKHNHEAEKIAAIRAGTYK